VNSNSVTTLWINPAAESDPSISTSDGVSGITVVSYALRENTGEGALNIDNLRVGTTFADVYSGGSGQSPAITSQSQNQTVTNGASVYFQHKRHRHAAAQLSMAIAMARTFRAQRVPISR
jgi:hypothetical protein